MARHRDTRHCQLFNWDTRLQRNVADEITALAIDAMLEALESEPIVRGIDVKWTLVEHSIAGDIVFILTQVRNAADAGYLRKRYGPGVGWDDHPVIGAPVRANEPCVREFHASVFIPSNETEWSGSERTTTLV